MTILIMLNYLKNGNKFIKKYLKSYLSFDVVQFVV